MGLDAVEIVMAVEDAFDIQIQNSEAEKILTPGQLIDLVISKVQLASSDVCLTHRAFNLLRRFLLSTSALSRSQIAPRTDISALFPRNKRPGLVAQFATTLAIPAPPLVRANWLKTVLFGATCLSGLATAVAFTNSIIPVWLPSLLAIALTGIGGVMATRHLRTEFSKEISTVADLSRWIMTHKSDLAVPATIGWTREQVASRVRQTVIDSLACKATYREDASFIQDLGLS